MTPPLTPALETAIRALLRDLDAMQSREGRCPVCNHHEVHRLGAAHEYACTIPPVADALREAVSPPPSGHPDLGPMVKP